MPGAILGQIASQGIGALFSEINAGRRQKREHENIDKQTAANIELSKFAYDQDLAQWQRQNQYNTPAQQMERFKAAGLNPNLIYGQGTAGNASSSPQYQTVRAEKAAAFTAKHNPMEMLSQYQNIRQQNAQIDLTQQSANNVKMDWFIKEAAAIKGGLDVGKLFGKHEGERYKGSPYYRKSQAETLSAEKDASLKSLEEGAYQKLGVGGGFMGNFIRLLMMLKR